MFPTHPRHLESLKALTLKVAGIMIASPRDCATLSLLIRERTRMAVSETTIKRVYGFALSRFSPSAYTLNALAVFCGYRNWVEFSTERTGQELAEGTERSAGLFEDPLLLALLDTATPTVLLRADSVELTIVTYNQAYALATYLTARPVKGLAFWEAFDPAEAGGPGPTLLLEAFHEAISTQRPVQMAPLQYNIPSGPLQELELSWWDVRIIPAVYPEGIRYLILQVRNITDQIVHRDAIEQAIMRELTLAEDLATSNVKLAELNANLEQRVFERTQKLFESEAWQRKLLDNTPVAIAILKGPEHVIETANQKIISYWGKTAAVIGRPLAQALPELEGQPFIAILDEVRATGIPFVNAELEAFLDIQGHLEPRYFDMVYQPVQHVPGVTDSIFIVAVDITDHVNARKQIEGSKTLLSLALRSARIGTWSCGPSGEHFRYDPVFAQLLGWNESGAMSFSSFRERLGQFFSTDPFELDTTFRHFGHEQLVRIRLAGSPDEDGRIAGILLNCTS